MKKIILLPLIILTNSVFVRSQSDAESYSQNGARQYKMQYVFNEKTKYSYRVTYTTNVHRVYTDSNTKDFTRTIELYFMLWQPSISRNGFAEVNTYYDSIIYRYAGNNERVNWNSASSDFIPDNFDFEYFFPMPGKTYVTTISPYFEVANIESPQLKELREIIIPAISDSTLRDIWEWSNSDKNLTFYSDMNKNVIRSGRFAIDSIWKMRFAIPIENITYTCDTAKVSFYLYDGKNFNIKAEMKNMKANLTDLSPIMDFQRKWLPVDSTSSSSGFWDISISPRGVIDKVVGKFNTNNNYIDTGSNLIKFADNIETNITYELIDVTRWD